MAKAAEKKGEARATGARTKPAARAGAVVPSRTAAARSQTGIHPDILAYNAGQTTDHRRICEVLATAIDRHLRGAECKIWHRHPVWFLEGNPIVGYHKLKGGGGCIRLLFWSGRSFDEPGLAPEGGFQTAGARYTSEAEISAKDLKRWLEKSAAIQWDYKNIVKRKGRLERLK